MPLRPQTLMNELVTKWHKKGRSHIRESLQEQLFVLSLESNPEQLMKLCCKVWPARKTPCTAMFVLEQPFKFQEGPRSQNRVPTESMMQFRSILFRLFEVKHA